MHIILTVKQKESKNANAVKVWQYLKSNEYPQSYISVTNFVDVVVEQFVNEVHMWQKHPPAAVSAESQLVQYFANVYTFMRIAILVTFTYKHAELVPFMSYDLPTTETTNRDYHVDKRNIIMMVMIDKFELIPHYHS